ncbi:MAG TPA: Hpt domain-containing protein, partial [Holophagaceae bacterium]|nr:Hpt domain-containing protein [Holophagaceae bacterium]
DFLQSAREDMEALAKGAEGRDAALATRHAHRLKGAAAMVGALPLAKVAAELEAAGRNQDWLQVARLLPEAQEAVLALARFAESSPGPSAPPSA